MKARNHYLYWLYMAGCFAYVGYEWYSYTGFYRLLAEWQLSTFGSYSGNITFAAPLAVLMIPGAVLAELLGLGPKFKLKLGALEPGIRALASPRRLLTAGLVLAAASAGTGWYCYSKTTGIVAYETFDLSKGNAPLSDHVTITGVAHPEYWVETYSDNLYMPITAADWQRGDPLVYFMKTHSGRRGTLDLSYATGPVPLTAEPGVLIENGLPGPVAEIYRKHDDMALARSPVVLDHPGAETATYFVAAAFGGIGSIYFLVVAATTAFRRRRQGQA
jgi:hypothetical protein